MCLCATELLPRDGYSSKRVCEMGNDHTDLWAAFRSEQLGPRRTELRNRLVETYRRWAERLARSTCKSMGMIRDMERYEQTADVALIDAVERYDCRETCSFHSFARIRIRGAVINEVRLELGRSSSPHHVVSLFGGCSSSEDGDSDDAVPYEAIASFQRYKTSRRRMPRGFAYIVRGLTIEQQTILYLRFVPGMNAESIAAVLGVSAPRISQIMVESLKFLREKLVGQAKEKLLEELHVAE
jgi:RNA polymerase sigma factor (sigma-70 family)